MTMAGALTLSAVGTVSFVDKAHAATSNTIAPKVTAATATGYAGGTAWTNQDVTVHFIATDDQNAVDSATYEISKDGGKTWSKTGLTNATATGVDYKLTSVAQGMTNIQLRVKDKSGNISNPTTDSGAKYTVNMDNYLPLSNYSNGYVYTVTNAAKITFSDAGSGIASATLDGKTITSGTVKPTLGTHTLSVTDKAGNKQSFTFTVVADHVAGAAITAAIATSPTGYAGGKTWTNQDVTVHFSTIGAFPVSPASYEVSTDNGLTWSKTGLTNATATGVDYKVTKEGTTNIQVRAQDPMGLPTDPATDPGAKYTVNIDKVKPVTNYAAVSSYSDTTAPKVTFSDAGSGLATATLDGASITSGTVAPTVGTHTLVVTDKIGNVTNVSFTVVKSSTVPSVIAPKITAASATTPSGYAGGTTWTNQDVTVHFTATDNQNAVDPATYEVSTDNGLTWSKTGLTNATATGVDYKVTKAGTTIIQVRVKNKSGKMSEPTTDAGAIYRVNMDKTKPIIVNYANGVSYAKSTVSGVIFTDAGSGIAKATYDGILINTGKFIPDLGTHTVVVTDKAGNVTTISFTIIDDSTPPIANPGQPKYDGFGNLL